MNEFLKEHRNVAEQKAKVAEQQSTIAELKTTVAQQQKHLEGCARAQVDSHVRQRSFARLDAGSTGPDYFLRS